MRHSKSLLSRPRAFQHQGWNMLKCRVSSSRESRFIPAPSAHLDPAHISSKTRAVSSRVELAKSRAALSAQYRRSWGYPDPPAVNQHQISPVCHLPWPICSDTMWHWRIKSHLPGFNTLNLKLRLEEDFRRRAAKHQDIEPKPSRTTWIQVWVLEGKTIHVTIGYSSNWSLSYTIFMSYSYHIQILSISHLYQHIRILCRKRER